MAAVSERLERSLAEIVGSERLRTDRVERKMYSFDIGAMPALVKPFVPAGVAGAVVRPSSEEQLVKLVKLAQREGVKLVPRSWATSGYGGVLPPEGAIVVDLSGWQKVLDVDAENLVVRTQGRRGLGTDRPAHREGRAHPPGLPIVLSEFFTGRLARPGWQRLRELRVRHLQGERRGGARGLAERRGQGVRGRGAADLRRRRRGNDRFHHRGLVPRAPTRGGGAPADRLLDRLGAWRGAVRRLDPEAAGLVDHLPEPRIDATQEDPSASPRAPVGRGARPLRSGAPGRVSGGRRLPGLAPRGDRRCARRHRRGQRRHRARRGRSRARVGAAVRSDAAEAGRAVHRPHRGRRAARRDARGPRRDRPEARSALHSRGDGRQGRQGRAARLHPP